MAFVWPVLLAIFRTLYFLYALWCLLFPLALACVLVAVFSDAWQPFHQWPLATASLRYGLMAFGLLVLGLVFARRTSGDPNPFQSAFMSWFGTLRCFWNMRPAPMVALGLPSGYLVENPGGYRITGRDTRAILNQVQPGDILLRGFQGYLDGAMIRRSSRCSAKGFEPGWFTHVALYVGALDDTDKKCVPGDFADESQGYFAAGPQMVIHSMAKGVHAEDILTFCRCDFLAVLRIKPDMHCIKDKASELDNKASTRDEPSTSDRMSKVVEQHMVDGKHFERDLAIETAKRSALEKIGEKYDFDCSDTTRFHRFSCAELVYYCYRGIRTAIDLKPEIHGLYPLGALNKSWAILKRETITPDDYYALIAQGTLDCIWQDPVSQARYA